MSKFKYICSKIAIILDTAIGISFAICLFGGALGFIGYLTAFFIGGETAVSICTWIYKTYYAFLIKVSTITTLATFVSIYINGKANWINPIKYWKNKLSHK